MSISATVIICIMSIIFGYSLSVNSKVTQLLRTVKSEHYIKHHSGNDEMNYLQMHYLTIHENRIDLHPVTSPSGVRVEPVLQRQPERDSLSCYADDDDCTPVAIAR